jgi:glycosyltransferase involved in cell wall biosynthesis
MRVALVQLARVFPPVHGGARSNRLLMEELARRGWECRVLAPMVSDNCEQASIFGEQAQIFQRKQDLTAHQTMESCNGLMKFNHRGVAYEIADLVQRPFLPFAKSALTRFQPGLVLVSDCGGRHAGDLLGAIEQSCPGRLVYLPKTANLLPCGPCAAFPDIKATTILTGARCIVANSRFVANLLESELKRPIAHAYFPLYAPTSPRGDVPGYVTLINACDWKGLPILLSLASRRPDIPFAAVHGWGTTHSDIGRIHMHPNITIIPFSNQVAVVFAKTRILLVPSLWHEAFGQVVIQAMMRGIPVLASDVGGLPEAKLGVPYLIPVHPITRNGRAHAEIYSVPDQDPTEWLLHLDEIWNAASAYQRVSEMSRSAALDFISRLSWDDIIGCLNEASAG